jgi:hypothetical protein
MSEMRSFQKFSMLIAFVLCFSIDVRADATSDTVDSLVSWCVKRMSLWAPPGRSFYENAKETPEDAIVRYGEVAKDAIAVVYDPAEVPLFTGRIGRARTLAVILAVSDSESGGYRKDVDFGIGSYSKGDGGKSWCLGQINLGLAGPDGKTSLRVELTPKYWEYAKTKDSGLGGEDLVQDRKACFRVQLHMIRQSFATCSSLPVLERLGIYASGKSCEAGKTASQSRIGKAVGWLANSAPPVSDRLVVDSLYPDFSSEQKSDLIAIN